MPALTQHRIRCATLSRFNTRHSFHDPFDFDDRPHIERLMKLALANVQGDIAADMDERMWAQVKLADAGNLSRMSDRDWELTSNWFLTQNIGYIGLQLLDQTYHKRRTAALREAVGLDAAIDFLADASLQHRAGNGRFGH